MGKYDAYRSEVLARRTDGQRSKDIAEALGIDARRVSQILRDDGIHSVGNKNERLEFSSEHQRDVFMGALLGDGCLFKCSAGTNYRFNMAHSLKQEKYFLKKYDAIQELMQSRYHYEKQTHPKTRKEHSTIKVQSKTNEMFTDVYDRWYKNGKKIMRKEIETFGRAFYAVKYFDDGWYLKGSKTFSISMARYDNESCIVFMTALKNLFDVETTLQKGNAVYIKRESAEKFRDAIREFATSDVLYKLGENGGTLSDSDNPVPSQRTLMKVAGRCND